VTLHAVVVLASTAAFRGVVAAEEPVPDREAKWQTSVPLSRCKMGSLKNVFSVEWERENGKRQCPCLGIFGVVAAEE